MKTFFYKYFAFVFIAVAFTISTKAQQQSDSLINYLEIAVKNNPSVLQRFAEYEAALQKIPQAGGLPDPEINVGVFLSPMELISGNQVADIKLMQMFPWFGTLKAAKDEMSMMAKAKFETFRDAKVQVFYNVQQNWYELYKIRQEILITENSLELLGVVEKLTLTRYSSTVVSGVSSISATSTANVPVAQNTSSGNMQTMGNAGSTGVASGSSSTMPPSNMNASGGSGLVDIYRIQIEASDLQNSIATLKSNEQTLVARFNNFLNRPDTMNVFTPDTLKPELIEVFLGGIPDSVLAENPMLQMLQYEQGSYEARKKMVTRMGYPMIGVGVNYSVITKSEMSTSAMNGRDMIMPMLTLTLPIYRRKYTAMKIEADLLKSAAGFNYDATANSLQNEYYDALQSYQDADRRMRLYANQSLLTQNILELSLISYATAATNMTDILQINRQLLDYKIKQVEALTDFNTAVASIKRLIDCKENPTK
jgi:outer membrane protein TolC